MQVLFAIFMTDVVGLKPVYAAAAIFIGRTWDYINDPLVGFLTDRTRTRWGRRRPFLLFGFIPFGLTFAMMWYRPPTDSQFLLAAYYALAYFLFDTSYTFVTMPYSALTPELTQDYDERTSLTTYRMAFSIFGSLLAFTVPLLIIGSMRPENTGRVFTMGIIFGTACALPLILTFFGTRERPEYFAQSQPGIREFSSGGLEEPSLPVCRRHLPLYLDCRRYHPGLPALLPEISHEYGSAERPHPGSHFCHCFAGFALMELDFQQDR